MAQLTAARVARLQAWRGHRLGEPTGERAPTTHSGSGGGRPEYVAQCFIKLVETGNNGDVMIVSLINTLSKKHLSTNNFSR